MKKKVLVFGASNSLKSINKKLATYASNQLREATIQVLDLNDFEMPIYSIDRENETGIPSLAREFKKHIKESDGIIISFAEHNGAYTTAFKNILDWISRLEGGIWENKPMLLLSTSPGGRGGKSVLELAANSFKHMNGHIIARFSLPSFHQNFSEKGIADEELSRQFEKQRSLFADSL